MSAFTFTTPDRWGNHPRDWSRGYRIYRNLHKDQWSIQMYMTGVGWRVIGHSDALIGIDVDFVVSEAGRQRVLREGRKNVHAYAVAEQLRFLRPSQQSIEAAECRITYNPYVVGHFRTVGLGHLDSLPLVHVDGCVGFTADGRLYDLR